MKKTVDSPQTLIELIAKIYPHSSRNKLRKMLTEGRISVNNTIEHKAKKQLEISDTIEILDKVESKEITPAPKQKPTNLNIIFEDEEILVVEKPAGLLSIATDKLESDTLHSRCVDYTKSKNQSNWCYIVHRLDKKTSGIMVLTYTKSSKEYLQEQFANRRVYRTYHALVEGNPTRGRGTEIEWLLEDKNLRVKNVKPKTKGAKEAITHWETIQTNGETSLIRIMIETGRRHQIRMAMKSLGVPVVGDSLHGANTDPLGRICLHASALEFIHPETDEPLRFETKAPFILKSNN